MVYFFFSFWHIEDLYIPCTYNVVEYVQISGIQTGLVLCKLTHSFPGSQLFEVKQESPELCKNIKKKKKLRSVTNEPRQIGVCSNYRRTFLELNLNELLQFIARKENE